MLTRDRMPGNGNRRWTNLGLLFRLMLLSVGMLLVNIAFAQQNPIVGAAFVKKQMVQKNDGLGFNIIRVFNLSEDSVAIKPLLNVPDGWAVFSTAFQQAVVPPRDTLSLPFSLRMPSEAQAEVEHEVVFQAFSKNNKLLTEAAFVVKAQPFHKWDVTVPGRRFYFYPRMNKADFEIVVQNQGNTAETVHIEIKPDKKLTVESIGDYGLIREMTIPAHSDSVLYFSASYIKDKERIFDISRIQVLATARGKTLYRAIILEKYDDTYSPVHVNKNLPHEAEVGLRTFTRNNEMLPYIKARGLADFDNRGKLSYNFTYHDLTQSENIIGNSYYQFLYSRNSLNVGLGAFSSNLGRNLYSRNCLMFSNEIQLSPSGKLLGYASLGYVEPKTSVALGYNYEKNDFRMNTAVAYDVDINRKVNTGSFMHRIPEIMLHKNHRMAATAYSYYESHSKVKEYTLAGVAYDLQYSGIFGKRFTLQINNTWGSPEIPGPQMGLLTFSGRTKYYLDQRKRYFSIYYLNSSKDYFIRNEEGAELPEIKLHDQYINLLYHSNALQNYRWSFGPSVEHYKSRNPLVGLGESKNFDIKKYRLEYRGFFGRNLSVSIKGGLSREMDGNTGKQTREHYDFHLLGDYATNGYGLRFAYDYGPMVNTGLYQYALDAGNNSVNISPYIIKNYLSGMVSVSLFANFTHRIDMEYSSLNINPRVETYTFRDWYVVFGGTYNFTRQVYNERAYQNSFFYLEVAVKKRWGRSDKDIDRKELVRLKVQVFQDDNGNGIRDEGEQGIPFVKTRILLTSSPDRDVRESLPVDITLLSNESGYSIFNRVPKGFYDVFITPLSELKEYFYVNQTVEKVELLQNHTYEIPFQKANKIVGQIIVKRRKFLSKDEQAVDLKNIRVTAYNNEGNIYSAFTDEQGRFVLFAPGGMTYYLRMENVFGNSFRILQNDIPAVLTDSTGNPVIFNVVEQSRKVNIKKAGPADDHEKKKQIQKIRVLSGELYENVKTGKEDAAEQLPDFNIGGNADAMHEMIPGRFYVIVGHEQNLTDALTVMKIFREMGISTYIGIDDYSGSYYIFTNYFQQKSEAGKEAGKLKSRKIKKVEVLEFNP